MKSIKLHTFDPYLAGPITDWNIKPIRIISIAKSTMKIGICGGNRMDLKRIFTRFGKLKDLLELLTT